LKKITLQIVPQYKSARKKHFFMIYTGSSGVKSITKRLTEFILKTAVVLYLVFGQQMRPLEI
jgi:spore coat polysaccharide biosynthesis predicted glycosyltransferase SpsG